MVSREVLTLVEEAVQRGHTTTKDIEEYLRREKRTTVSPISIGKARVAVMKNGKTAVVPKTDVSVRTELEEALKPQKRDLQGDIDLARTLKILLSQHSPEKIQEMLAFVAAIG